MPIGLGESKEAAFTLREPIAAGTWHLVGDGEGIAMPVDVRFDIVWRTTAGASTVLASTTNQFSPPPPLNQYNGVMFEADLTGLAAPAARGDQLVLRFATVGGAPGASYIPNGDGALAGARIPNLTLPQPP